MYLHQGQAAEASKVATLAINAPQDIFVSRIHNRWSPTGPELLLVLYSSTAYKERPRYHFLCGAS